MIAICTLIGWLASLGHYGVSVLSISQSRLQFLRFPSSKLSSYYAPRAKKHNVAKRFVKQCKYCACTSQGYDGESSLTISQPLLQSLRFLCSKLSPFINIAIVRETQRELCYFETLWKSGWCAIRWQADAVELRSHGTSSLSRLIKY